MTTIHDDSNGAGCDLEAAGNDDYVNARDLFYWMEDTPGSDIPLCALWIDIPTGCRFCC